MADRYVVAAGGNWNDNNTWSATDGGAAGASFPTAADNAYLSNLSGNLVINVTSACLNLDCTKGTGYTGTISSSGQLDIHDSLTLRAGMTMTYAGRIVMRKPSGTATITTGGLALICAITFQSASPSTATFRLADNFTTSNTSTGVLAQVLGTFDPNGKKVTLTSASTVGLTGALTFFDLERIGAANKTCNFQINVGSTVVVTGTLTVTGNSVVNRVLVQTDAAGTQRTLTAAAVALTNVDWMDIAGAGAAAPFTGTSMGDCQGNSGITFDAPVTQTATGTASFTWSTHGWTTRVPLPQDDVVIPNAFVAGRTITVDMSRVGRTITFTCTGNPTLTPNQQFSYFGSWQFAAGMTTTTGFVLTSQGRTPTTFRSNGVSMTLGLAIATPGCDVTLLDALTTSAGLTFRGTNFNDGGFSVTCSAFDMQTANTKILSKSGAWTITGSGASTWVIAAAGTTINDTGSIKFTDATGFDKTFAGAGMTYRDIWLANGGPGRFVFTGNNTFNEFRADAGTTIRCAVNTTQTAATWRVAGSTPSVTDYKFGSLGGGVLMSTPHPVASLTGDLDFRVRVWIDAYGTARVIFFSTRGSASAAEFDWLVESNGTLALSWYSGAGVFQSGGGGTTLTAAGVPTQQLVWLRSTRQNDRGDGKYEVKHYFSAEQVENSVDVTSWTQIGAAVVGAAVASVGATAFVVNYGGSASGNSHGHRFVAGEIRDGIGGSLIVNPKATNHTAGLTMLAGTGETWTVLESAGAFLWTSGCAFGCNTINSFTLAKAGGGLVECSRLWVSRSIASPGSTFYAWDVSIDAGSNSGWTFGTLPIELLAGSFALTGYGITNDQPTNVIIQVRDDLITRLKAGLPSIESRVFAFGELQLEEVAEDDLPAIYVEVADDSAEDVGVNGGSSDDVPNVLEDLDVGYNVYCIVKQGGDAEKLAYALRSEVETALFDSIGARTLDGKVVWLRRQAGANNRDDAIDTNAYSASLRLVGKIRHLDKNPDSFTY